MIYPVGISQFDLQTYDTIVRENLNYRLLQAVDNASLDPKKPNAFISSLDFSDNLRGCLKHDYRLKHVFFTVAGLVGSEVVTDLVRTDLNILPKVVDLMNTFVVLSASIYEWYNTIVLFCNEKSNYGTRVLCCEAMGYIEQLGFKDLFTKKIMLRDKTYSLA